MNKQVYEKLVIALRKNRFDRTPEDLIAISK